MQLDLLPRQLRGEDFPATKFLADVIRHQMGKLSLQELRNRWAKGEYTGVNPDWAKEQING